MTTPFSKYAHLTERRKADRLKMARIVADLAKSFGAETEIVFEREAYSGLETRVFITAQRGVKVSVSFQQRTCQTKPDTYVLSWHIDLLSDARFALTFTHYDGVNPFHRAKATTIAYGFEQLLDDLDNYLGKIRDGDAFDLEYEADYIAKNGTAAERNKRFLDSLFDD